MARLTRRDLLHTAAAGGAALALGPLASAQTPGPARGAVAISSANGRPATARAFELLGQGRDVVEAAVEGVVLVEEDPDDTSVGIGGLPNEAGVVELDACVMHGPSMRAGAVASLQNIKTPSRVALEVMRRTDHVLLVGPGALTFAKQMGFREEELLTERARQAWLRWKSRLNPSDNWLDDDQIRDEFPAPTGTITNLCLNARGELGGCTSTSGLAWKIPGRVGDSPLIGAGLYVDGEVGACGSTGRGEANILVGGSRIVVENMRRGMAPMEACLDVLKRVAEQTRAKRLLHAPGRPNFELNFYALRRDGAHAAARIYRGGRYAVTDERGTRLEDSRWLFEGKG
jgi:N4-(beta-N-acetylglucosaminyl)-L-asparaginase